MIAEVFSGLPNELKTIEIDVEKRKFLINGESFGCSRGFGLEIVCEASEGYEVFLRIDTDVKFQSYTRKGEAKTVDESTEGGTSKIIEYLQNQLENEEFSLKLSEKIIKREQENVEIRSNNIETIQKVLTKLKEFLIFLV